MKRYSIRADDLLIALVATAIGAVGALIINLAACVEVEEARPAPKPIPVHVSPTLRRAPPPPHGAKPDTKEAATHGDA